MKIDWTHFQSYPLWVAIFAFVLLVLQQAGVQINPVGYSQITTGFLGILVLLGIVNNPSSLTMLKDATPEQIQKETLSRIPADQKK